MRISMVGDRDGSGMFHAPLRGDCVEVRAALFNLGDNSESVMFQRRAIDDRLDHGETATLRRTHFHERRIFEFADEAWTNAVSIEPFLESAAPPHVLGRQERRRAMQRLRKITA